MKNSKKLIIEQFDELGTEIDFKIFYEKFIKLFSQRLRSYNCKPKVLYLVDRGDALNSYSSVTVSNRGLESTFS